MVKNEINNRYGKLLVIERIANNSRGTATFLCKCDCGNYHTSSGMCLRQGKVKSCGCLNREKDKRHGMSKTPEFKTWQSIWQRCTNTKDANYKKYGAKGITVTDDWKTFEAFFFDMGNRPSPQHSIDRINNHQGYSKLNCRWATFSEQNRNKSDNRLLTMNGDTKSLAEWCEITGIPRHCLTGRLRRGWTEEKTLTYPYQQYKKDAA